MFKSQNLHLIVRYTLVVIGFLLIIASLLSLVYNIPKWYLKILDFPRLQQFILGVLVLILFLINNKKWNFASIAFSVGLLASVFIHFSFISSYLVGDKVVQTINSSEINEDKVVSILIANVLIKNKDANAFLEIVKNSNADMVLAMEVDSWWVQKLQPLTEMYPYTILNPLNNAYGMALYSKFRIKKHEIQFLNHSKVPSFNTEIMLASGARFKFYGVHPVAPFPSDKYPENIGEKAKEEQSEIALTKVGKLVSGNEIPTIVAGDFNDVSWSNTSRLFGNNANLKDVRIGRGLYNTFDAQSMIMRWPLDHFFVSEGIKVIEFKRLPKFGSDHFPLFAKFQID
tara:strand:+ start:33416 stop:34441 length:1026 start_codon:yes stop_codon:yes gene_type:complete